MATESLNLAMINMFIGLMKGSRLLRPASAQIKELGYRLYAIEPRFTSRSHSINPEAIACSESQGHTLLTEWTEINSLQQKKVDQIMRYLQVSRDELIAGPGIPPIAAGSNGTWVVVKPEVAYDFTKICNGNCRMILSSFEVDLNGYHVKYIDGALLDPQLTVLIRSGINIKRLHLGWVRFSLDNLRSVEFSECVIQQLMAFIIKDKHTFATLDVAREVYNQWHTLDIRRRHDIQGSTQSVLKELSQKTYCGKWLSKGAEPRTWDVLIRPGTNKDRQLRALRNGAERYLSTLDPNRPYPYEQYELDLDFGRR